MIAHICDQCGGDVGNTLYTATPKNEATRHFCDIACLADWARETSTSTPKSEPEPSAEPEPDEPKPTKMPRPQDSVKRTCEVCGREGTRRFVETATGWRCAPTATACIGNQRPNSEPPKDLPDGVEHGKYTTYDRYGCHCDPCRDAHAVYVRNELADRRQLRETVAARMQESSTREVVGQLVDGVADKVITITPAQQNELRRKLSGVDVAKPPITARCRDCARVWDLTGRVLDQAIALHEHRHHSHIVDILDQEATNA